MEAGRQWVTLELQGWGKGIWDPGRLATRPIQPSGVLRPDGLEGKREAARARMKGLAGLIKQEEKMQGLQCSLRG